MTGDCGGGVDDTRRSNLGVGARSLAPDMRVGCHINLSAVHTVEAAVFFFRVSHLRSLASHAKWPNQLRLPTWVGSIPTQIVGCYTGFPLTRCRTKFNLAEKNVFSHYLLLNALGGGYLRARLRQEYTSG